MTDSAQRVDAAEVEQFGRLAEQWWDPQGPLATLHAINSLRVAYISERRPLAGLRVADVGCGGGILSEAMAVAGAQVTGIDMAERSISVARAHASAGKLDIEYVTTDAFTLAAERAGTYDVVTCLEVLEHVPDPQGTVLACAQLLRPGGDAFFSTINRNPKSFALAIVAAEYVLGLLPRGTHRYQRLIRPSELARHCRAAGLEISNLTGLHRELLHETYRLGGNIDVNYFCHAVSRG